MQQPDLSKENQVILNIDVSRNNKVKVHKIYITGNKVLSDNKIKRTMKKTNENGNILNIFKQKKFVERDFEDDLKRIVDKYNELGYRDAKILSDSVVKYNDNRVDVYIDVEEGQNIISATSPGSAIRSIQPKCSTTCSECIPARSTTRRCSTSAPPKMTTPWPTFISTTAISSSRSCP